MKQFLYHLLFYDQRTQEISHTRWWSNVGYAAMTYTFVYSVMYGTEVDVMIWALFGLVVIGNRTILQLMRRTSDSLPAEKAKTDYKPNFNEPE